MAYGKKILLIGDSLKVREFETGLQNAGALITLVPDVERALASAKSQMFDGIVFIIPVYWESVSDFVKKIRAEKSLAPPAAGLALIPIIYLGDFIESSDQIILKSQGVKTLTLGPVPTAEAVRFILNSL